MKLFLVVIQDKDLPGEPDIGMAIVEGNRLAADNVRDHMERDCIKAGRARCTGRVCEIERGKHYRAATLIKTQAGRDREETLAIEARYSLDIGAATRALWMVEHSQLHWS